MSLQDTVKQDDTLKSLKCLRDVLAYEIDQAEEPNEVAALASRLRQVLLDIEERESGKSKGGFLDDFDKRRGARGRLRSVGSGGATDQ